MAIAVPMHTALRLGAEIAARVRRRNPAAVICCFGLYAWLNAETLLDGTADYVIGGESEGPLLALAEALAAGESEPVIAGAGSRAQRAAPSLARTDFPAPARDSLPELRRYAHLMDGGRAVIAGYTETTRGCHHTCLHCPVVPLYRGRFFAIPRAVVLADIRQQVA
ncbi:MAG TPA: CUAEP/CCAEP-tail radical SAM protein, partial [Thermomicrobiaceae bacterium]|nr:CUAEP/CCAEP-tail radical SAM protein [Thermomicrobiaceae bacterium]